MTAMPMESAASPVLVKLAPVAAATAMAVARPAPWSARGTVA